MKRGLRYLPTSPRGRTRATAFGLGLLAALSLFWQQQATLAAFVDTEYGRGTFTARTLDAISPTLDPSYSKIDATWDPAQGNWATPQYALRWSADSGGASSAEAYAGSGTSASLQTSSDSQANQPMLFTDVAAGATHACGIARGGVYCWGTSATGGLGLGAVTSSNYPRRVTGGALGTQVVVQVTAGTNFTCVRAASGTAYCWGIGTTYQLGNGVATNQTTPVAVSGLSHVTDISAGATHACAVDSGTAYCWGYNYYSQLGDNTATNRSTPTLVNTSGVLAGRTVSQISAGTAHTCAVADGRAYCWGQNTNGRVGDNSVTLRAVPVAVYTGTVLAGRQVSKISAGALHSCAVADGLAFCWGANTNGRLGDGTATQRNAPVAVVTTVMTGTVIEVSAGSTHTCAVAGTSTYCWGAGTSGQIGNNASANSSTPIKVLGSLASRSVSTVSVGTNFSCATGNTIAACWGLGTSGQLGNSASTTRNYAVDVNLTAPACPTGSVMVGSACSLAEDTDYYLRLGYSIGTWTAPNSAWVKSTTLARTGVNPSLSSRTTNSITAQWSAPAELHDSFSEYTLRRSSSASGSNPQTVAITPNQSATDVGGVDISRSYSQVSVGTNHACAILDGSLYCWGANAAGQLGLGNTTDRWVPTKVTLTGTVTKVSAAETHTCAIAGGVAYCWGTNTYGQLGDNSTTTRTSPVVVANQGGVTVLDITAGTTHSCAITQGGQAWCWGRNNYGQLGNNSTTNSSVPVGPLAGALPAGTITQISAGLTHTCGVANQRAYCWGRGNYGQLGFNSTQSNLPAAVNTAYAMGVLPVTSVSSGANHTCAIADSRAFCWGYDYYGQVGNGTSNPASQWMSTAVTNTLMSSAVSAISAGVSHSCATSNGRNYCWGLGTSGQMGNVANTSQTVPVQVSSQAGLASATAQDVAAGSTHSCGIFSGKLYCWGVGTNGRLGVGDTIANNYPVQTPVGMLCATGATSLGDGTCSLTPGTTYYYQVAYSLDGSNVHTGSWVAISTS